MTKKEYDGFLKAVMAARSMIEAYLKFAGGTVSALAQHLNETMESLSKILSVENREWQQDECKRTFCPMFNEMEKAMNRVESLGNNLPGITFIKEQISIAAVRADLLNAIQSFKQAEQEFSNMKNHPR